MHKEETMPSLDTVFAYAVAALAGLAVIGALAVVIVAEVYAIRRTIDRHRQPARFDPTIRYWREHSALRIPKAEAEQVRDGAGLILAGQSPIEVALDYGQERQP
jgi:hypothetical protein